MTKTSGFTKVVPNKCQNCTYACIHELNTYLTYHASSLNSTAPHLRSRRDILPILEPVQVHQRARGAAATAPGDLDLRARQVELRPVGLAGQPCAVRSGPRGAGTRRPGCPGGSSRSSVGTHLQERKKEGARERASYGLV